MKDEIKRFYTFFRNNEQTLKELKNEITGKIKSEKAVYMQHYLKSKGKWI